MNRTDAINALKSREVDIRRLGIDHVALFGSTARNAARPESDLDLVVTFDPSARIGVFRYLEIIDALADLLGRPVDIVTEPARTPHLQAQIDRDRVDVF